MDATTVMWLRKIGQQLDAGMFPKVFNDGIIAPNDSIIVSATGGAEQKNGSRKQSRPAAGSWEGTARRERKAGRSRSSRNAAPLVNPLLRREYRRQLDEIRAAYPRTKVWDYDEGMWLSVESAIIGGLDRRAAFVVAIPFFDHASPKAWGFWTRCASWDWIGPRHTNFPDGSICAFEPRDCTWSSGDKIMTLLDLYTLWALRHLHLELVGHWPGRQSVAHPYERLHELKDGELCGCDDGELRYGDCCKPSDLAEDHSILAADFLSNFSKFQSRKAPQCIQQILTRGASPPSFHEELR